MEEKVEDGTSNRENSLAEEQKARDNDNTRP